MVATKTLQKVALAGVILVGGAGIFVQTRIRQNFCRQGYYSLPLKILEDYKPGNDILGKPIGIKKVDLADTANNWTNGLEAKVAIPLEGARMNGTLHAWSARTDMAVEEHHYHPLHFPSNSWFYVCLYSGPLRWTVKKADLEVNDQQWTFYIHPDARDTIKPTHHRDEPAQPVTDTATPNISPSS